MATNLAVDKALGSSPQHVDRNGHRDPSSLISAGSRGTTNIADRVVAKIAEQAADEIDHVGGHQRRLIAGVIPVGHAGRPHATAHVDGQLARLEISLSIDYPAPVRAVTRQVRDAAITRIWKLASIEVKEVDITVVDLPHAQVGTSRVE